MDPADLMDPSDPRDRLYAFHLALTEEARRLCSRKNQDYARGSDPFANFRLCEVMGLAPTTTGILIRLSDKLRRLASLEQGEAVVRSEKVRDTVIDAINYLVIYTYVRDGSDKA